MVVEPQGSVHDLDGRDNDRKTDGSFCGYGEWSFRLISKIWLLKAWASSHGAYTEASRVVSAAVVMLD